MAAKTLIYVVQSTFREMLLLEASIIAILIYCRFLDVQLSVSQMAAPVGHGSCGDVSRRRGGLQL
jgi:hypothetical protein